MNSLILTSTYFSQETNRHYELWFQEPPIESQSLWAFKKQLKKLKTTHSVKYWKREMNPFIAINRTWKRIINLQPTKEGGFHSTHTEFNRIYHKSNRNPLDGKTDRKRRENKGKESKGKERKKKFPKFVNYVTRKSSFDWVVIEVK